MGRVAEGGRAAYSHSGGSRGPKSDKMSNASPHDRVLVQGPTVLDIPWGLFS